MPSPWLKDSKPSCFRRFCCGVLKSGPIPSHVAIIMDGNRRYARKARLEAVIQGHSAGFDKLTETLEWCRDLGILEVTAYAFSIENFKRTAHEVNSLMDLAKEKFQQLLNEKTKMQQYEVRFRFFGDLSLLPKEVQKLIAEIEITSRPYTKHYFNVCLAYTSQDEIARAVRSIAKGVEDDLILPEDVSEDLISKCLDTSQSPDPDILIRTSGEERFSDFLLWQSQHSCLYFVDVLWPEFSFWNFSAAVLYYQRHSYAMQKCNQKGERLRSIEDSIKNLLVPTNGCVKVKAAEAEQSHLRVESFLQRLSEERERRLVQMATG